MSRYYPHIVLSLSTSVNMISVPCSVQNYMPMVMRLCKSLCSPLNGSFIKVVATGNRTFATYSGMTYKAFGPYSESFFIDKSASKSGL